MSGQVTPSDWVKGIAFSILASIIGGASKLAIRKSWLMEANPSGAHQPILEDQDDTEERTGQYLSMSQSRSSDDENPRSSMFAAEQKRIRAIAWTFRLSGMIGMTFLNPLCCVLAMNYASPSILAPFSGLTLVWIVLLSDSMIGERPEKAQVMAAGLIVLGEVVVAVFGDHSNDEDITLEELRSSYRDVWFLLYFAAIAVWMCTLAYWMKYAKSPSVKRFAWGVAGGSVTGLQNFLKDSLTILKASKGSFPWYLALMVILAVSTAFGGLLLLTACMKRYDATYSSAMFVGSFVVSASFMSAVHYHTFANLESIWDFLLYPLGLVILMVGVCKLVLVTSTESIVVSPLDFIHSENGIVTNVMETPNEINSLDLEEPLFPTDILAEDCGALT